MTSFNNDKKTVQHVFRLPRDISLVHNKIIVHEDGHEFCHHVLSGILKKNIKMILNAETLFLRKSYLWDIQDTFGANIDSWYLVTNKQTALAVTNIM